MLVGIGLFLRQAQEPNQPDDTIRVTTVTDRTRAREKSKPSALKYLKWIFAILVALIVLLLVIRFGRVLK